jgi:hypothetical protein
LPNKNSFTLPSTAQVHPFKNRMIFMYSPKDWSFNQILACLWSFLSISAFVSINFCNFAVKRQKIYHGKVKSYNGNLPAEFNVILITAFKVEVKVSQSYTNENG